MPKPPAPTAALPGGSWEVLSRFYSHPLSVIDMSTAYHVDLDNEVSVLAEQYLALILAEVLKDGCLELLPEN